MSGNVRSDELLEVVLPQRRQDPALQAVVVRYDVSNIYVFEYLNL